MDMISFLKLREYADWYDSQTAKIRAQIDGRLEKIREFGHYGHVKKLSSVLSEIKFNGASTSVRTYDEMFDTMPFAAIAIRIIF